MAISYRLKANELNHHLISEITNTYGEQEIEITVYENEEDRANFRNEKLADVEDLIWGKLAKNALNSSTMVGEDVFTKRLQ